MNIGMLVFPDITAIDYVGPADLLARIPGAKLELVWKHVDTITTGLGWEIRATQSFESCDQFDMIVVPGGSLQAIAQAASPEIAQGIQLFAEYDPQPPFDAGTPNKAPAAMVAAMRTKVQPFVDQRRASLMPLLHST